MNIWKRIDWLFWWIIGTGHCKFCKKLGFGRNIAISTIPPNDKKLPKMPFLICKECFKKAKTEGVDINESKMLCLWIEGFS